MPPPTNVDFLSATNIGTTLPYSNTQDVRDAGINYTVYYEYVVQPGDIEIGVFGFGALSPGYQPLVNVYLGPAGAPTTYTSLNPITGFNIPIQIPVAQIVGQSLFFEFISFTGNGPDPAVLTLNIQSKNATAFASGDIFISDDTISLPAVILDGTTGAVKRFVDPFPAGEAGDILSDGTILHEDQENGEFDIWSSAGGVFSKLFDVAFTGTGGPVARSCNGGDCFYAGYPGSGGTHALVKRISKVGAIGPTIGPFAAAGLTAIAAKNDETLLYYAIGVSSPIKVWNIGLNSAAADLVAAVAGYVITDILYQADDTLVVQYYNGATGDQIVKNISIAGAILHTYNFGSAHVGTSPRLAYTSDNPNSFLVWEHLSGVTSALKSKISKIKVSDGSVLNTFTRSEFEGAAYNGVATATPTDRFGNSFSCPFFELRTTTALGSITVIKVTVPAASPAVFGYTTTGGLIPATFNLSDGGNQVFSGLGPGIYGVTETPVVGWTTGYVVSNGDPHGAINIAGNDVTVTVTNTQTLTPPSEFSGIYKLVPGKRNDTLWNQDFTGTEDVKIPNPTGRTGYIG